MQKNAGFMYGPDGAACNPFIGDSYLFMNNSANSVNETNNFGQGQQHSSQETTAMNGPATSYSNYISQPHTGARRSLSGNSGNAVVAPQIINQMDKADEVIAQAKRTSGDFSSRRRHTISSKKNQSQRSDLMRSS